MKRLSILITIIFVCLVAMADSYSTLWKQHDKAAAEDLPQTQLSILRQISAKASANKDYGQLIKSELTMMQVLRMLSTDSIKPAYERIVSHREQAEKGKNEALKAVWNVVLGKVYYSYNMEWDPQMDKSAKAKECYDRAMHNPAALAVPCKPYAPIINEGKDAGLFMNDLLSIIAYETGKLEEARQYYESRNNREAMCAIDWFYLEQKSQDTDMLNSLDSLIAVYPSLPITKRIKARRDRMYKELTCPSVAIHLKEITLLPNTETECVVEYQNVSEFRLSISRLNTRGCDISNEYDFGKLSRLIIRNSTIEKGITTRHPSLTETERDTLMLPALKPGVYLMKIKADGIQEDASTVLYVSDVYCMTQKQPEGNRIVVVSATTGKPISGATVTIKTHGKRENTLTLTTDSKGECVLSKQSSNYAKIWAETREDKAMCPYTLYGSYSYIDKNTFSNVSIFTDRSIYRPGQTIKASILAHTTKGEECKADAGKKLTLRLMDHHGKNIKSMDVTTDDMGTASFEFELPKDCSTGLYRIQTQGGSTAISVEEYKRPTFEVELQKPEVAYVAGDTITVSGKAKTYSGVPVAGAKVSYAVKRNMALWWCSWSGISPERTHTLMNDTITTDEAGNFSMKVPMLLQEGDHNTWYKRFYNITVNAEVTDINGETHKAELALPLGNKPCVLTSDLKELILSNETNSVRFTLKNNAGTTLADRDVRMSIDGGEWQAVKTDSDITLSSLASGRHSLTAICEGDTLKQSFILFSLNDDRCPVDTLDWFYKSAMEFGKENVIIQAGSSEDVYIIYTIFAGNKVMEQGSWQSGGKLKRFELGYKPEYGDGVLVDVAWVWKNRLYSHQLTIKKPLPDKTLKAEWKSFRDRTLPGSKETWTLQLTTPDGKPANAQMVATLYDKSLDALLQHRWNFRNGIIRHIPYTSWSMPYHTRRWLNISKDLGGFNPNYPDFSCLDGELFNFYRMPRIKYDSDELQEVVVVGYATMKKTSKAAAPRMMAAKATDMPSYENRAYDIVSFEAKGNDASAEEDANVEMSDIQLRSDFSETGFFMPQLHTDEQGTVTMDFTLPESVTTWRFMGFAHTADMQYAITDAECIAQKPVMVQPNMPRFLRLGDKAQIPVRISAIEGTELAERRGTAVMTIIDAKTMKRLYSEKKPFAMEGQTTAVTFSYAPKTADDLICRVTVEGKDFSDGEQHLLPVLSDEELIITTRPFTMNAAGTMTMDLSSIKADSISIDYCASPAVLVREALPHLGDITRHDAIDQAAVLYAASIEQYLTGDTDSLTNIINQTIQGLKNLQGSDGGWSWCPGMTASPYMTEAVTRLLARMAVLTGHENATVKAMRQLAMTYLDKDVAETVKEMKKDRETVLYSDYLLDYLYVCALTQHEMTADIKYLMSLMKNEDKKHNIHGKAVSAIVLDAYGKTAEARKYCESLRQHTVYTDEMGRYYDGLRASYSWMDYRIPTQVAAIEALQRIEPQDRQTIDEMRRWLLQEKRTTAWNTVINSCDAVYAFMVNGKEVISLPEDKELVSKHGLSIGQRTTLHESSTTEIKLNGKNLSINKLNDGVSWGAVYAYRTMKAQDVEASGSGMTIRREIVNIADNKVKVRITIRADRDYDFVEITDKRAACMEPVSQHSGYIHGNNGAPAYVEPHDSETIYYIHKMHKGTHQYETEYFIDRKGDYHTGTATVRCAYAPEFRATIGGEKIKK